MLNVLCCVMLFKLRCFSEPGTKFSPFAGPTPNLWTSEQHLISGLQNIYFNRHLNGFGNQMKDSEFWESSACISIIKTQSHEIKISRF